MKGENIKYEVLNPWADVDIPKLEGLSPRVADLTGKTIGLLYNAKVAARPILTVVKERLRERFPTLKTSWHEATPPSMWNESLGNEREAWNQKLQDWVKGVDAAIIAVGDCGACTKYGSYDAITAEQSSTPAVMLVAEGFENDVRSAVSSRGIPGLRFVTETVPCECTIEEKIQAGISEGAIDNIIAALTRPLTAEEQSPSKEVEELPRIVFKGDPQEVNRFFYKRGWTDGLPIIPPTEESVEEMLTGTGLPADHVVARITPRLGKATIEKIAINAVMAGALPTYMPLLITGVQLLADPAGAFGMYGVSTSSRAPFWIINGPVRIDANIHGGIGALSPGHIANATIGRALGLIVKNIGGIRPGIEDMAVHGNPMRYSMVVGENEEESPWEPLHVERGRSKEDSAITLFFPNSYTYVLAYSADANGILNTAIHNIPPGGGGALCMLVNPTFAKFLADEGWTKKEIQKFIKEHARCPRDKHWLSPLGMIPKEFETLANTDSMPLIISPDGVSIIVCGKFSSWIGLATGSYLSGGVFVTKKVELPANWKNLVEKYKDIVPTYIRY